MHQFGVLVNVVGNFVELLRQTLERRNEGLGVTTDQNLGCLAFESTVVEGVEYLLNHLNGLLFEVLPLLVNVSSCVSQVIVLNEDITHGLDYPPLLNNCETSSSAEEKTL